MHHALKKQRLVILLSGVCGLMLMLGIARFAYTPLMPLMQQQADLGVAAGGWLASINYLGYLSGVLLAACISKLSLKFSLYRAGIVMAVITTAGMAWADNVYLWALMRYLAGFSSASGVMFGSGLILHWLMKNGLRSELGIHFSGAGLGIALGAIAIELSPQLDWAQQWWMLGILGVLLAVPAWLYIPCPTQVPCSTFGQHSPPAESKESAPSVAPKNQSTPPSALFVRLFMAFYGCAGIGYVISATFIVAIIVDQVTAAQLATSAGASLSADALAAHAQSQGNYAFLLLGLAAAPACMIWDFVARRIGHINTLIVVSVLHTIGIILPALITSLWAAYLSTLLFGATFIGLVSLVLTMSGRYYPEKPAKMMGKMTFWYSVAQIIAPAITGFIAEHGGEYSDGLMLGAGAMVLSIVFLFLMKRYETRTAQ